MQLQQINSKQTTGKGLCYLRLQNYLINIYKILRAWFLGWWI